MSKPTLPVPRKANGQFQKGVSGNPTGKAARRIPLPDGRLVTQTELFQMDIAEVHKALRDIVLSPTSKDRDKIVAGKILLDRAFGTPKQQVEITKGEEKEASAISLKDVPTEALRELVNRLHGDVIDADIIDNGDNE